MPMKVQQSKFKIVFLLMLFTFIGCENEDMSYNGLYENIDTDKYKPNQQSRYAPIPGNGSRSDDADDDYNEPEFRRAVDTIQRDGLADYVNDRVSPYNGNDPCTNYIAPADIAEFDEKKECIPYNKDQYGENGGAQLSAYINEEAKKGTRAKKAAFFRAFGPLAVKMQDETGYPASALLSQWAEETGWGVSSRLLRKGNGIGGHSCFSRRAEVNYDVFRVPGTKNPGVIKASCTYQRPSNEGAYYLTFKTLEDSAYAQVQNILFNPRVQRNYRKARNEIFQSVEEKRKADPAAVLMGLDGYAAFPADYKEQLVKRVRREKLEVYDQLTICQDKEETDQEDDND